MTHSWFLRNRKQAPEMVAVLLICAFLSVFASASFAAPGSIKLGTAQQGIDGTCDFGYDVSKVNAVDTMAKYFDRIGPYGECGVEGNPLKAKNPTMRLQQYISLADMWPKTPTAWATAGSYESSRKVGFYRAYLVAKHAWNANKQEKLYLHFYDNTTFTSGGVSRTIPGCFKDSSQITAADSVSRVPNGYSSQSSYWGGNTYTYPTRLWPNLTTPEVRKAMVSYIVIACTATTGGSSNFWPGKNFAFDGVFFDNSSDIGLGLNVTSGGHIVESYNVALGPIANNIASMVVSSVTSGAFLPVNRTPFDIWWWEQNVKKFLMVLDTTLDTLTTPTGYRPRYMLNAGYADAPDHFHDPALMEHDNLLEWGGVNNRGHSNSMYDNSGVFPNSMEIQLGLDSISKVRGNTRQVWVRTTIGNYTGAQTTDAGGGTQSWHEGWKNTLILFLTMNGDSTYYDMWDNHAAYYGSGNPTAATSAFDSLHFGSQGAQNLRGMMNRNLGAKMAARPTVFATGTSDGDSYEVWGRRYAGNAQYPNGWLVLFRERSCGSCEFMSNSSPATVALAGSYKVLQNDNNLTTGTVTSIQLRAGEGAILYASVAVPNNAPGVPSPTSPIGGASVSTTPTLTCAKAVDADNPPSLNYRFQVSTSSTFASITTQTLLSSGSAAVSWVISPTLAQSTTHYWRVRAYDFADSSAWSSTNSFVTGTVVNTPPVAPVLVSPLSGATVATAPTLTTNKAVDPDNSTLLHTFQVATTTAFSAITASGQVSAATATIGWNVAPALTAGATYYWRVNANDGTTTSPWSAVRSFVTLTTPNTPPTTPALQSPANNTLTSAASPTLTAQNSTDANGNTLVYHFQVYDSAGVTLRAENTSVAQGSGGVTSWTMPTVLSAGSWVRWRVRAYDGAAYSAYSGYFFCGYSTVITNQPPSNPNRRKPAKAEKVIGLPILFEWDDSYDPNAGDQLGYDIWISSDSVGGVDLDSARNVLKDNVGSTTSRLMNPSLVHGQTYWWTIRANDGQLWTARTPAMRFEYFDFSSGTEDGQPTVVYPPNGTVARSSHPTLVVQNIPNAGSNSYFFYVASDSFFANIVAASPQLPQSPSGETSWTVDSTLNPGLAYYWRARVNNYPYSATGVFTVSPSPHASPVPFRPATDGVLTFHELPDGSDLIISALNGELVIRRLNISGGTWFWDGKNASGILVASGVYLWFIDGTDLKGKLIVQR